jgi:hypothetical protein
MPAFTKFLVGLAAVTLMTWLAHGPVGGGASLIDRLEADARAAVAKTEVPGVSVRLNRDPLSRQAVLSGPADRFQREGQGSLKGLNDIVGEVEGISGVSWANPPVPAVTASGGR